MHNETILIKKTLYELSSSSQLPCSEKLNKLARKSMNADVYVYDIYDIWNHYKLFFKSYSGQLKQMDNPS